MSLTRIINYETDPQCALKRPVWGLQTSQQDNKWVYENTASVWRGFQPWGKQGACIAYDRIGYLKVRLMQGDATTLRCEYSTRVYLQQHADGSWLLAVKASPSGDIMLHMEPQVKLVLLESGVYEPTQWDTVRDLYEQHMLPSPWFDATTMPLNQ